MIYTFKCKAAGDITMTQADGDQLLQIIGKTPAAKGIIEVAAVPAAIHALEDAVAREQAMRHQTGKQASTQPRDLSDHDDPVELVELVELHQRIWPLLEMLKRARDEREVVVWGV